MGFDDFIDLMDSLIRPCGAQLAEESAPDRGAWKAPSGSAAVILTYEPEDVAYPVRLDFSAGNQAPLLFKLDDYGARSAAIKALAYFGIDNDLNVTDDDTG
ncbi:MAG TPA: hypothetical protein VMT95_07380 [Candidatus Binatia bacterium]|nr:hypothetical protein [Candidatus Binatia bacterium]